jgi:hypothetical protein
LRVPRFAVFSRPISIFRARALALPGTAKSATRGGGMARSGRCVYCDRSVFVPEDAEVVCPVCATPLLEIHEEKPQAS